MKQLLTLLTLSVLLSSCSSGGIFKKDIPVEEGEKTVGTLPESALSRQNAANRSHQVGHISYALWFGLDATNETFEGRTVLNFELKPKAHDISNRLVVDFEGGALRTLSINGSIVKDVAKDKEHFDGHHIIFKLSELQAGANRIEIAFSHPYSKNSEGLYRFVDPDDQEVYLYSDNEPYSAHTIFPCFDQPDLKASYELTVEAPKDWQVIANTLERTVSNVDGRKSWAFPPSPLLSTYLFALIAGPYKVWKSDANGTPLRLFSRKSIAKFVDAPGWLDVTQKGLDFYAVEFGYPYPYSKYDQIIVPDFNEGAMENAGAVTFSERFLFRTKITQDDLRHRASVILHEMAHMWFGDLVTMRWWNGLWLNESFATFMSSLAVDQATSYKGSWQNFFSSDKTRAYNADQLVTTHPVEVPVADTLQAESNFDGITYGKGASSIKQLRFLIGEDEFRDGVQRYFQKYALRNTTTQEFVKMLSEASGRDLSTWQKTWLQTQGVNTLKAEFTCGVPPENSGAQPVTSKKGRHHRKITGPVITSFKLIQGNSETSSELRLHKTQILLARLRGEKMESIAVLPEEYSKAETSVTDALGQECPDFVFPNFEDYDYVKVELDAKSLKAASDNLSHLGDSFLTQMIWGTLQGMLVDSKLSAEDYVAIVMKHLGSEKNTNILTSVLDSVYSSDLNDFTAFKALPLLERQDYLTKLAGFFKKHFLSSAAGSDVQFAWYKAFVEAATPHSADYFRALLKGREKIAGINLDQNMRWDLVGALAGMGVSDAEEFVQAELKRDSSDFGQNSAIGARVRIPEINSKKAWFAKIIKQDPESKNWPVAKLKAAMDHFQVTGQEFLSQEFVHPFFDLLPALRQISQNDNEYMNAFTRRMFPGLCNPDVVQLAKDAIAHSAADLPARSMKSLKVGRQWEERCIKARQMGSNP